MRADVREAEWADLATVLDDHARRGGRRILLLVDEVYRQLVYDGVERVEPFSVYPWTALARSFSKDLGLAGERIGYLAIHPQLASPEVMRGLETAQRALGFVNAPATMQRMLLHLPSWSVDVAPHRKRRDHALRCARHAGLTVDAPDGGLYLWARTPWEDGLAFVMSLAERRVLVAPGVAFEAPQWMRICFTAPRNAVELAMELIAELGATQLSA